MLEEHFIGSKQVRELNLENATDIEIWSFSKSNGYTIVTFDADFADISSIKGCPPKVIWLRTGNTTTKNIAELLVRHQSIIKEFIENDEYKEIACIEIE